MKKIVIKVTKKVVQKISKNFYIDRMVFTVLVLFLLMGFAFIFFVYYPYLNEVFHFSRLLNLWIGLIVVFTLVFFIPFVFFKKWFIKILQKNKKNPILFLLKKINGYVLLSLFLFGIFLIIGIGGYLSYYGNVLPLKNKAFFSNEEAYNITKNIPKIKDGMNCQSLGHYTYFVEEDKIMCDITFDYGDSPYRLHRLEVKEIIPQKDYFNTTFERTFPPNYDYDQIHFDFETYSAGHKEYWFAFDFIDMGLNNTQPFTLYDITLFIPVLTKEEYNTKKEKQIPIFIALLSIAFFSILAGVRNLKGLIENG